MSITINHVIKSVTHSNALKPKGKLYTLNASKNKF